MNLRGHLDDDTMRKLSVMASAPKPAHRDASKVKKNPEPQVLALPADERRRLAKTKSKIERRERRKRERQAQRSAAPISRQRAPLEAKDWRANPAGASGAARSIRRGRTEEEYILASEASRLLGITMRDLWVTCQRYRIEVHRGQHRDYLGRAKVGELRELLLASDHKVDIRFVASTKDADLQVVQKAILNRGLRSEQTSTGRELIRFEDYGRLLKEIDLIRAAQEELQNQTQGTHWGLDGVPLQRYEKAKQSSVARKKTPQYIQVVTGGLPTLGSGHK